MNLYCKTIFLIHIKEFKKDMTNKIIIIFIIKCNYQTIMNVAQTVHVVRAKKALNNSIK